MKSGRLLTLNDSRYVLVEPPHHVAPQKFEAFFDFLTGLLERLVRARATGRGREQDVRLAQRLIADTALPAVAVGRLNRDAKLDNLSQLGRLNRDVKHLLRRTGGMSERTPLPIRRHHAVGDLEEDGRGEGG